MIKARGRTGDGRPLVVLGLSEENLLRLMRDEPISFDLDEIEMGPGQMVIVGGISEDVILRRLRRVGLMDETTEERDLRG